MRPPHEPPAEWPPPARGGPARRGRGRLVLRPQPPGPQAGPPGEPSPEAQETTPEHNGGTETGTGYPVAEKYSANGREDLGYQPGLDYPAMPDYPPPGQSAPEDTGAYGDMPGYPPSPGYSVHPDYGDMPGYPSSGHPAQTAYRDLPGHGNRPAHGHDDVPGYDDTPAHSLGNGPGYDDAPAHGYDDAPGHGYVPGYPASPESPSQPPYNDLPGYPPPDYRSVSPPDGLAAVPPTAISHDEYDLGSPGAFPQALEELGPAYGGYLPGGPSAVTTAARGAGPGPAPRARADDGDARQAMLAYLTVPFFAFLVPFAIYIMALRRSRWLRAHASQALNVWITALLYDLSAAIMGVMLALDSPAVALATIVPLVVLLWLITLAYLIRAAVVASQGREYTFPRWLCSTIFR